MTQRGPALVRSSLVLFVLATLLASLGTPTQAGTQAVPEIADPANDMALVGEVPITMQPPAGTTVGLSVDLLFGWVEEASPTELKFTVQVQGPGTATTSSEQEWRFHFTIAGTEYIASARSELANQQGTGLLGDGSVAPGGVTSAVTAAGDGLIVMLVPKASIGSPAGGSVLSSLFVESESLLVGLVPGYITDRAPNDGFGTNFTLSGGGNVTNPNDTDGDGLNDTCEMEYFGNLTAANATADADGDGLTNGQECALGTDPTKADSDGDGVNDKNDPFPTDPAKGGSNTSSSSSSSSTTTSSTTTSTSRPPTSSSSSTSSAAQGNDKVDSLDEAVDRLTSDAGYLGFSSGGFLAVVVLAILGLAVRWSL